MQPSVTCTTWASTLEWCQYFYYSLLGLQKKKNTYKMLFSRVEDAKMISKTKKKGKKEKKKNKSSKFCHRLVFL